MICPACEYRLEGIDTEAGRLRCPECGHVWLATQLLEREHPSLRQLVAAPLGVQAVTAFVIILSMRLDVAIDLFLPVSVLGNGLAFWMLYRIWKPTAGSRIKQWRVLLAHMMIFVGFFAFLVVFVWIEMLIRVALL